MRARPAEVFDTQRRPWIQPQHASVDALDEVIARCPTQALKLVRDPGARGIPGRGGRWLGKGLE
ncbi:(4Fe-4S)-binding protein [Patulibacter sp. NPDC049589]|uniref:(4Fe-4S)-binding protein n=1 Tax=Patulibacter sp. NPDC049589 TaxID=3154731 RepID=UPI0034403B36